MARVLITGSSTGLGRAAAEQLIAEGHHVVVHARHDKRAADLEALTRLGAEIVIGDLANETDTRAVAQQANSQGRLDAVIHNAAVYIDRERVVTAEGHARTFAVNVLAPYLLTAWIDRPSRLIYLTSGMHRGGSTSLHDLDWQSRRWSGVQAYSDSKLYIATLSFALARKWPDVLSHTVDPGWVPTRMGGPSAPDDLDLGHRTQTWLAVSNDDEAVTTGGYWYHQARQAPASAVEDERFQEALLAELARITGVDLA